MCGNDAHAKARAADLFVSAFGWSQPNILDLGDISGARGMEMILPLWVRLFATLKNPNINFHVASGVA